MLSYEAKIHLHIQRNRKEIINKFSYSFIFFSFIHYCELEIAPSLCSKMNLDEDVVLNQPKHFSVSTYTYIHEFPSHLLHACVLIGFTPVA